MQARAEVVTAFSPRLAPASHPRTLDALSLLESGALELLFAAGDRFAPVSLQGHPRGRVLAIPGLDRG